MIDEPGILPRSSKQAAAAKPRHPCRIGYTAADSRHPHAPSLGVFRATQWLNFACDGHMRMAFVFLRKSHDRRR
jgi:hypothetical protein